MQYSEDLPSVDYLVANAVTKMVIYKGYPCTRDQVERFLVAIKQQGLWSESATMGTLADLFIDLYRCNIVRMARAQEVK